MLVIFGTGRSTLVSIPYVNDEMCPHCHQANSLIIKPKYTYFHIFWIPMIALSSKHELECMHCKKVYPFSGLPANIKQKALSLMVARKVKRPIWNSLGCMVIGAFILLSFISFFIILIKGMLKG